jgi:hypothetical protein
MRFLPIGSWRCGELTRGGFRSREVAVWASSGGTFFQPVALGEGNPWRVSSGVEGQNRVKLLALAAKLERQWFGMAAALL